MKIYTRTGDDGTTALFGGGRVSKASPRVAAYGNVDALNSWIGLARVEPLAATVDALLERIQNDLFTLGAELAVVHEKRDAVQLGVSTLDESCVEHLEQAIDIHEATLTPLRNFILPGGTRSAAVLHVARTSCRAVERELVSLAEDGSVRPVLIRYFNRLSDLLFVLARVENHAAGVADVRWAPRENAGK